jgi:hypothetical protein
MWITGGFTKLQNLFPEMKSSARKCHEKWWFQSSKIKIIFCAPWKRRRILFLLTTTGLVAVISLACKDFASQLVCVVVVPTSCLINSLRPCPKSPRTLAPKSSLRNSLGMGCNNDKVFLQNVKPSKTYQRVERSTPYCFSRGMFFGDKRRRDRPRVPGKPDTRFAGFPDSPRSNRASGLGLIPSGPTASSCVFKQKKARPNIDVTSHQPG